MMDRSFDDSSTKKRKVADGSVTAEREAGELRVSSDPLGPPSAPKRVACIQCRQSKVSRPLTLVIRGSWEAGG
jgi:hypothetical protein